MIEDIRMRAMSAVREGSDQANCEESDERLESMHPVESYGLWEIEACAQT